MRENVWSTRDRKIVPIKKKNVLFFVNIPACSLRVFIMSLNILVGLYSFSFSDACYGPPNGPKGAGRNAHQATLHLPTVLAKQRAPI